jgi:FkbM family methyltransferase
MSLLPYLHEPSRILRKMRWSLMQSRHDRVELTADTWNGRLTFNSDDRLISKFLYVRRAYEQHYVTQVIEYLDRARLRSAKRDVVLDVGANIGMIAIALVKHGWFHHAVAFEPEQDNFRLLEHNVRQNGYELEIKCHQVALSSRSGEFDLVLNAENSGGHFIQSEFQAPDSAPPRRRVSVKTVSCDELLDGELSHLADRVGLVWMDIEGHEGHFLEGASKTLARGIPVVSEFYPRAIERSGTSRQEYLDLVRQRFTHVCTCSDGHFVEQPISAVAGLFDQYEGDGTNVIYLRR